MSVGHSPEEWSPVNRELSVAPGCPMEDPGMGHPPGTAWLGLNWPKGLRVTTVTLSG